VGWLWKQELQKRGAVHFHLALYGLLETERLLVQTWFAENWNDLICEKSTEEERRKHFVQHMRQDNFQEIRDFAGYFAKYLGKDAEAQISAEPIPGRWWGIVNRKCIPWAELAEIELPARVRLHAQRVARKLRQKRADAAKYRAQMKQIGMVNLIGDEEGPPVVSQFRYTCGRRLENTKIASSETFISEHYLDFRAILARLTAKEKGVRVGKCKFPNTMKFATVKMIGKNAPALVGKILLYAYGRAREDKERMPF
jgi:hypothetical protein